MVGNGTVNVSNLYIPTINLATDPATYTATVGLTFETLGLGAFAPVTGKTGTMNGTIKFSKAVDTTIEQTLPDFFVFNDGVGGTYNFSVSSVLTRTYSIIPNVTTSISLYLLGTTVNTFQNLASTPTSLTLSLNSTSNSPFSSAATLSVPPAGAVPEAATWAMMVGGFGLMGGALRRSRSAKVTFA